MFVDMIKKCTNSRTRTKKMLITIANFGLMAILKTKMNDNDDDNYEVNIEIL